MILAFILLKEKVEIIVFFKTPLVELNQLRNLHFFEYVVASEPFQIYFEVVLSIKASKNTAQSS